MRKTIILNNRDLERLNELKDWYQYRDNEKKSYSEVFKLALYSEWLENCEIPRRIKLSEPEPEEEELPFN